MRRASSDSGDTSITPALRRTLASVLLSLGEEVPYVMEHLEHTDPHVTFGIYAGVMRRSAGDRERIEARKQQSTRLRRVITFRSRA